VEVIENVNGLDVVVILPCKGTDIEIENNILALKAQKFPNYKIVAVVDSHSDSAYTLLKKHGLDVLISSNLYKGSGKVKAISTAMSEFSTADIFVLVDSDTRVNENWLSYLVNPLKDQKIGAVSTYPYYDSSGTNNLWNFIKKAWGYLGINMMEFRPTRFVWGGSTAFRSSLIFPNNFQAFSQSISDDSTITKICKDEKKKIVYSKMATPIVMVKETKKSFLEWSNRQIAISVNHSKSAFYAGLSIYLSMIAYLIILIPLSVIVWPLFILGYIPWILSLVLNISRQRKNKGFVLLATALLPFIYVFNMIVGIKTRHIEWRGTRYKLKNDKI
jgi:cellulose synthase/poly-beta-1,6-N-acetylglucosamine synthase-like glycosyltransferase